MSAAPSLYNNDYFEHIARFSTKEKYQIELQRLLSQLELTATDRVLDVGCGTGSAMRFVAANLGCEVQGYEVSRATEPFLKDLKVAYGDGVQLPFPDSTFDCVYLLHSIGHAAKHTQLLQEVRRVLKTGGRLGIITPGRWNIWCYRPLNILGIIPYKRDETVLRYYTRSSLVSDLRQSGFSKVKAEYFGPLPSFLVSARWASLRFLRERVIAVAER